MINIFNKQDLGVVGTNKKFVLIIHEEIYGPYKIEDGPKVLNILNDPNGHRKKTLK